MTWPVDGPSVSSQQQHLFAQARLRFLEPQNSHRSQSLAIGFAFECAKSGAEISASFVLTKQGACMAAFVKFGFSLSCFHARTLV